MQNLSLGKGKIFDPKKAKGIEVKLQRMLRGMLY